MANQASQLCLLRLCCDVKHWDCFGHCGATVFVNFWPAVGIGVMCRHMVSGITSCLCSLLCCVCLFLPTQLRRFRACPRQPMPLLGTSSAPLPWKGGFVASHSVCHTAWFVSLCFGGGAAHLGMLPRLQWSRISSCSDCPCVRARSPWKNVRWCRSGWVLGLRMTPSASRLLRPSCQLPTGTTRAPHCACFHLSRILHWHELWLPHL